ncbi:MAG: phosphoglycolate phosphatase [Gammaproteobacteria bacterium]|nr:phosphoglycolate phosphatase [Gammaproteobacteria bacterium]
MGELIQTVLFDLDGTLADTAPDLAFALNEVRRRHGLDAMPFENIRPVVSHGGVALIRLGFAMEPEHPRFEPLRQELLDIYLDNIAVNTTLFNGMDMVLDTLEAEGKQWGVVTNKPGWLTEPLMRELGLTHRAAAIVSGDTLPQRKPHPAPIIHACEQIGCEIAQCLYVGDAERDVEAGHAAGMKTMVALFGYIGQTDQPQQWGADSLVETPADILNWLTEYNQLKTA